MCKTEFTFLAPQERIAEDDDRNGDTFGEAPSQSNREQTLNLTKSYSATGLLQPRGTCIAERICQCHMDS